jgi:hypothetical protein
VPGVTEFDVVRFEIDKCRIFISDEQDRARSQCWYIRSVKDHVYVGPEPTGNTSKLTFHAENGGSRDGCNSHWGLTRDYAEMEKLLGTPNLLKPARWKRPETPSVGVAQVASIMFPTDFLEGSIPPFKSGRKRIALPLGQPRHAIEIGIFYSREDPSTIRTEMNNAGGAFIGHMSLPGGENVVVAAREVPFETTAIPLASEWERVGPALSGAPKVGESIDNCGAVLLLDRPADGQVVTLAEINGITIERNC